MKETDVLKVNGRIEVTKSDDTIIYKSLIQDVLKDNFLIDAPIYRRQQLRLSKNDIVNITTLHGRSCFKFSTEVTGTKKENNVFLYLLKKPTKYKKIERRDFVRVETALEITYEIIQDYSKKDKVKPSQKAYTIDLSAGGVQLMLSKPVPYDTPLVIELPIPMDETNLIMKLYGRVVRRGEEVIGDVTRYKTGIKFEDISERERDILVKYIFYQMRKTMHLRRSDG